MFVCCLGLNLVLFGMLFDLGGDGLWVEVMLVLLAGLIIVY